MVILTVISQNYSLFKRRGGALFFFFFFFFFFLGTRVMTPRTPTFHGPNTPKPIVTLRDGQTCPQTRGGGCGGLFGLQLTALAGFRLKPTEKWTLRFFVGWFWVEANSQVLLAGLRSSPRTFRLLQVAGGAQLQLRPSGPRHPRRQGRGGRGAAGPRLRGGDGLRHPRPPARREASGESGRGLQAEGSDAFLFLGFPGANFY